MSFLFGGKAAPPPNPAHELARNTRIAVRRLERDEAQVGKQESALLRKIKLMATQGKLDGCQAVAKELVRLRHHGKVLGQMRSQLNGLGHKLAVAESTGTIHATLGNTAKLLAGLNKALAPREMHKVLLEFQKQNTIFADGQEILEETLEDAFEGEDEGASIDAAVAQVFDEVGLDRLLVPSASRLSGLAAPVSDDDLARRLENLRA